MGCKDRDRSGRRSAKGAKPNQGATPWILGFCAVLGLLGVAVPLGTSVARQEGAAPKVARVAAAVENHLLDGIPPADPELAALVAILPHPVPAFGGCGRGPVEATSTTWRGPSDLAHADRDVARTDLRRDGCPWTVSASFLVQASSRFVWAPLGGGGGHVTELVLTAYAARRDGRPAPVVMSAR